MHLPFDIWLHIASFLPVSQLRNLYAVNRALFDIAMDERYKEIRFDWHRSGMIRKLKLLM
jgi:F-box-like